MNLLSFAFRNVMRNKKRTMLTATAVFFAAFVSSMSQGWVNGVFDMYWENYIKYQTAHIRVTTDGFIKREKFLPVDEVMYGSDDLLGRIRKVPGVTSAEERIKFGIILGSEEKTVFAVGMGVDLKNSVLNVKDKLKEGGLSESGIYIGIGLKKKLGVKIGDKLLLATKTSEGGLNGIKLPIQGVYKMGVSSLDDKFFFVPLADAKRLLKIRGGTTEIYIFTPGKEGVEKVQKEIKPVLPAGSVALNFKEQMKSMYVFFESSKYIFYFIEGLILFLASFVVINTMMMAIFERTREIGTLKAMGLTDRELFWNFLLEGGIIGAIGGMAGGTLGYLTLFFFNKQGIDFEFAMRGVDLPVEYIMRPSISPEVLALTILLSIIIPMASTIMPARYAWRLMPAEAIRKL